MFQILCVWDGVVAVPASIDLSIQYSSVNRFRADTTNTHSRSITTRTYRKLYNSYTMFLETYGSNTEQASLCRVTTCPTLVEVNC